LKDFTDEQAKINKYAITKFKAMDKILENIDDKVMEVERSIHQVLNMMKMLKIHVEQLVGSRWVAKEDYRDNPKVSRWQRLFKLIRERWRLTLRRPQRSRPKVQSLRCRANT
jgi:hypothetical protein